MKSFAIIQRKNPALKKCPSCFSEGSVYRSHSRNWKEKLIKRITYFRIYKCKKCGWRDYRSTVEFTLKSIQNLLMYIGIAIIIALIVRIILDRLAI
jgi:hypothetical protein